MSTEEEKLLKEAKKLPWDERLFHKNWKVRNEANIDLAVLCDSITDPKDPRLREFGIFRSLLLLDSISFASLPCSPSSKFWTEDAFRTRICSGLRFCNRVAEAVIFLVLILMFFLSGPLFKKTVADSNAPVQEKALDALIAFQKAADADAGRYAKEVCDAIVAKCLTGRPKTVEKAQAVFLLWVELEASEAFLESMEKAIKNKVAKAVVPAIDVMFQALSEFGAKVVPPKKILKMLPELFDHQDQNVRASSKGLTLELCRWIGKDPVKSILFEKMRDTMRKELETELANVVGVTKPTRKIRSEQDKEPEQETSIEVTATGAFDELEANVPQEIDEYELVDPVDILTPLEKSGFWDGVKATKWSERRDAVAELTKLSSIKKIAPGDFVEVCRTLKKLVTDVNLAVSIEAIQAIGNLARGLRTHFAGSSRFLLPVLLEKLKEKKPTLTEALTQTLQAMHKAGCLTLVDVIEDVKVAVKNKVPLVRSLTLNWVTFCIETSNKAAVLKLHKDYVPICMECLNDGTPEVRDASFAVLAAIVKMVGMRPLERSLEKLDEVRKKKLSEMIGDGSTLSTMGAGLSYCAMLPLFSLSQNNSFLTWMLVLITASISTSSFTTPGHEVAGSSFVRRSAASMLSGKRPVPAVSTSKRGTSTKAGSMKKSDGVPLSKAPTLIEVEDTEPGEMSLEEIEQRLGSLVKADTIMQLKSAVWKERLEAIVSLKEEVESVGELDSAAEILIRLLCILPGWAEKNVQVQQQVIEVITYVASNVKRFPKRCVVLCLSGISERVADIKSRAQGMRCLTTFSEAVGPGFIFDRLYKIMKEHKNPKVLSEGVLWMVSAIEDFGVSHIKLKDLIDFCKETGLQSSAAATRNSTIKLIGVLHRFVGPDIKGFLSDVKPALLSVLEAEYEKNSYEGATAVPKKTVKLSDSTSSLPVAGFDSLPREDISSKITPDLLKNLSSADWKVRLESVESVNKILEEAHKRIQPAGTVELLAALRGRLGDSNKNLVMVTLTTIGGIASAMGPAIEKSSKGILSDVLKCLGDNKKHMRECTLNTLESWFVAVQLGKMVPYVSTALADPKLGADGRKDLFDWLSRHLTSISDSSDALCLLKAASYAMTDKSADVRKAAETTLGEILRVCSQEAVTKTLKDLKGPGLAFVLERLKLPMMPQEVGDYSKPVTAGLMLKSSTTKIGKLGPSGVVDRSLKNGNKAISMRSVPTRASTKYDSMFSVQDLALQSQALFNVKDSSKEDRERLIVRRCKFEDPRPEQFQDLEYDMMKHFREDLHRRLLSSDFKKQVEGLDLLQKALPSSIKEIIELVDILLRWFVLRFCESNTTCLLKVLEVLLELINAFKDEGYALSEAEAAMFLPCLVEKSGHAHNKLREKMRELLKQIVGIYPASKLLPYILQGLSSKNSRTKIECVDFIGWLMDHNGAEISGQLKFLQQVASLTTERDGEIRKAVLNTMTTAYKYLGDDIWRYVGKLSDTQKSTLDDRFKWKVGVNIPFSPILDLTIISCTYQRQRVPYVVYLVSRDGKEERREAWLDVAELNGEIPFHSTAAPMLMRESISYGDPYMERHMAPGQVVSMNVPPDWHEAIELILMGSPEQSVEGMKVFCHELKQVSNNPDSSVIEDLLKETDRLVSCLATMVPETFNVSFSGGSSRSCKYVLNTLMQTFQIKRLAHSVRESTLDSLITELLLWLLDERVPLMDEGSQLLKALNVLMLKILDNAERTSSFVVLINLLRPLDPSRWPSPASPEALSNRNQKFSDLVVKCLIKLTKVLQTTIYDVDLDRVLHSLHVYLQELGMEEIRKRAGADDKPLRMVKTVLHELVKLRETAIKGHLSMVPIDTEPQPIILAYIDLNLQTIAAAKLLTPSGTVIQTHWGDAGTNNTAAAAHSADAQLKQELAAIFKKIGDKQTCAIGMYELYRITQLYPKVDIFAQLQNASEAFRTYIRDGLAQMEKNAAAGRMPANLPISTPPPLSMNAASPKFGPLSPVHQKAVKPDNNSTLPASCGSDVDSTVGEDQNDRISLGAGVGFSTGAALDAIRERMKSIQAAAAAATAEVGARPLAAISSNMQHGSELADGEAPALTSILPPDEQALSGLQARMERLKSGGSLEPL
ncbi:Protein MOR1 [Apostasia shenzhenica]|uniref:Protein MOR1 n=1 Tax=Apostasia shenzhenica TaxID=1088818 RepID=A0A2I0A8F7_9ASPA|nr:Protein MOR1 [Apostasia shenzhenica]